MTMTMLEWKEGDPPLTDADGVRLLFSEEVAEREGVKVETIYHHNAAARRARLRRKTPHFPAPDRYVRRTVIKANGQPLTAPTPVWREPKIEQWSVNRLGPGGRPRRRPQAEAEAG